MPPLNLLHLADLHLGKRVNGFDLLPDQRYILEQVLDLCTAHNVQAVALAGDIYDTALPPAAAVLLLDWFLTELAHRNIPVLAIAGNHDSAERLDYAAGLLSNQQVYLAGQFTSAPRRVILQDEFGELTFDLLPFVRPATVRHCLPDADIRDEDSAIAAALGPLPTAGERRVLIAHQMVLGGGSLPTCSGSESVAADVNVGTVQAVDAARFTGYLYTALGHIHRPQQVGCPTVRYAGSPLCYSLDECGAQKSAVLVHIGASGAEPELLPLRPLHTMRHLTGPLDQLTAADTVTDAEDYIWATLTDPVPRPDAMAVLRAAYPNAMKLDYAPGGALDTGSDAIQQAAQLRTMSFDELFARFLKRCTAAPLPPKKPQLWPSCARRPDYETCTPDPLRLWPLCRHLHTGFVRLWLQRPLSDQRRYRRGQNRAV